MTFSLPLPYWSDPRWRSAWLALGVHLLFAVLLLFGLSWQVREPEPVAVEVWSSLPPADAPRRAVARPQPQPRSEPAPQPPREVVPPRPTPPEPVTRADIALDKQREDQKRRAEQLRLDQQLDQTRREKAAQEEAARVEAQAREQADKKRRLLQAMADENAERQAEADSAAVASLRRQAAEAAEQQAAAAGMVKDFTARISAKVRGNTRLPDNLVGNPEVRFVVRLLPTGEVQEVRLVKSSGNPAYDEAVERAIEKSSPLPLPPDRTVRAAFVPELKLVHRPKD